MVSQNSENAPPLGAEAEDGMKVDVYQAHTHQITAQDLPLLHELTVGVFWPHRDRDLELFMQLGDGYLALDEIGRPLSSAMKFPIGTDFAMLGMMITAPRLQSLGTGRWLLRRLMDECDGRDMRLSATRAGYRLYQGAGFVPVATIRQQQGKARAITAPEPVSGVSVRPIEPSDLSALQTLDSAAFGADRTQILDLLLTKSEVLVAEKAGQIVGFSMIRNFGKGQVIGPVVAESDQMAMQLTAPLIQAREGAFLRLDTPIEEGIFTAFLAASGLGMFDTVTEMRVGPHRRATEGAVTYGLAAHSLG